MLHGNFAQTHFCIIEENVLHNNLSKATHRYIALIPICNLPTANEYA